MTPPFHTPSSSVLSRRLLVETLIHLEPFRDSITVLGGQAVAYHASKVDIEADATRDADAAFNPGKIIATPSVVDAMREIGLEQLVGMPGIYGRTDDTQSNEEDRATIDLIVPHAYGGAGRRYARVANHQQAMMKTHGVELTIWDREQATLSTVPGDGDSLSVDTFVAGPGSLLVAKAFKQRDRLAEFDRKPHRLRPKDSRDISILMLASNPDEVAERVTQVMSEHPETREIALTGFRFLLEEYSTDNPGPLRDDFENGLFTSPGALERADTWMTMFNKAASWLRE